MKYKSKYFKILTKPFLYKEYIENNKSILFIAKQIKCHFKTVYNYLKKDGIKIKTMRESHPLNKRYSKILTKKFLIKEYIVKKKPIDTIAKEVGCSCDTVRKYLIRYNIKIRNHSEAMKGKNTGKFNPMYGKFGKNNPGYIEGLIREYPNKFNKILKELIRERDNNRCQICGKTTKENGRKLDVHHINYDKDNLNPNNLISLCHSCHMKTNYNRETYIEFFKILKGILK